MYRRKINLLKKGVKSTQEKNEKFEDLLPITDGIFLSVDSHERKRRPQLKCLTISTSEQSSSKSISCFKLIEDMKNCVRSEEKDNSRCIAKNNSNLSYIFVRPNGAEKRSVKEAKLCEFLNLEGVFQINLGVVLNDYKISF